MFKNIVSLRNFLILLFTSLFLNFSIAANQWSDTEITSAVKSKLSTDTALKDTSIKVTTTAGKVALSGDVDSNMQVNKAAELAQSVNGVKDVDTEHLVIKNADNSTQTTLNDTLITAKVKGSFIQQKLFGDKDISAMTISVETNNGVVSLSGTAENKVQIKNAIAIAQKVTGVKSVKSTVVVSTN